MSKYKSISDLPDKRAEEIGLKKATNGYVSWLEDGDGFTYRPPLWLLDLIQDARADGHEQALANVRASLGLTLVKCDP